MDYVFQHHLDYEFYSDIIDSSGKYVATSTVVQLPESADGDSTTITGGTLPIGDYSKSWSSVDGNAPPTDTTKNRLQMMEMMYITMTSY